KNDESFLHPVVGESVLMRDPCVIYGPDKKFHMVWTTNWTGNNIGHAWSDDLLTWHDKKNIGVMADEPNTQNVWAPEMIYDSVNQNHLIFWSSRISGQFNDTSRIYSTTTTDFQHTTPRQLFYDPGFDVIDAAILDMGSDYAMFMKAEVTGDKAIYKATSTAAAGPYSAPGVGIVGLSVNGIAAEGPTAAKLGDTYYLYWDYFTQGRMGAATSPDLETWTEVTNQLNMPGHHGSVLTVSRVEFEALFPPPAPPPPAALAHRYSFAADATDSVGSAHGTLMNGASISGGIVQFDGDNDYVNLPAGTIDVPANFTHMTIEAWFSFDGGGSDANWARVFDFGDTSGSDGKENIFMTPQSENGDFRARISDADPGYDREEGPVATPSLTSGSYHVVVVYDAFNEQMQIYVNGVLEGSAAVTIPLSSVSNALAYLGRSLYDADPYLTGSIDEFRRQAESSRAVQQLDRHRQQAVDLLTSTRVRDAM
ncbi:MAG: family 43 glycosylhydrolase, partial [Rhodospirillales bacterium]|nr:family 43 glycosylhydrolase [Rhodospirillales bacterium]